MLFSSTLLSQNFKEEYLKTDKLVYFGPVFSYVANVFGTLKVDKLKVDLSIERSTHQFMRMEPMSGILELTFKHEYLTLKNTSLVKIRRKTFFTFVPLTCH